MKKRDERGKFVTFFPIRIPIGYHIPSSKKDNAWGEIKVALSQKVFQVGSNLSNKFAKTTYPELCLKEKMLSKIFGSFFERLDQSEKRSEIKPPFKFVKFPRNQYFGMYLCT